MELEASGVLTGWEKFSSIGTKLKLILSAVMATQIRKVFEAGKYEQYQTYIAAANDCQVLK